jgi:hypothetical protein
LGWKGLGWGEQITPTSKKYEAPRRNEASKFRRNFKKAELQNLSTRTNDSTQTNWKIRRDAAALFTLAIVEALGSLFLECPCVERDVSRSEAALTVSEFGVLPLG